MEKLKRFDFDICHKLKQFNFSSTEMEVHLEKTVTQAVYTCSESRGSSLRCMPRLQLDPHASRRTYGTCGLPYYQDAFFFRAEYMSQGWLGHKVRSAFLDRLSGGHALQTPPPIRALLSNFLTGPFRPKPTLTRKLKKPSRPKASLVLTKYLEQCKEPPWTSYFVKYKDVEDDHWGKSHFNWTVRRSIPCLLYGISAIFLIRHTELVNINGSKSVPIFFLYKEDKGSLY
ncbi:hypothetical protein B566_EDAN011887 [Ephemera danica]|nr:hypothetical protein B566_EDAN011887 [Ephemera danica]